MSKDEAKESAKRCSEDKIESHRARRTDDEDFRRSEGQNVGLNELAALTMRMRLTVDEGGGTNEGA